MAKKTKPKGGHWLVTTTKGVSHRFQNTKKMVAFVRKNRACLISYIQY